IWYFDHPLPNGYSRYSKTRPLRKSEFELEKAWWDNRVENEYAWKITIDEVIKSNYNLNFRNPYSNSDTDANKTTLEMIQDLQKSQEESLNILKLIEQELS